MRLVYGHIFAQTLSIEFDTHQKRLNLISESLGQASTRLVRFFRSVALFCQKCGLYSIFFFLYYAFFFFVTYTPDVHIFGFGTSPFDCDISLNLSASTVHFLVFGCTQIDHFRWAQAESQHFPEGTPPLMERRDHVCWATGSRLNAVSDAWLFLSYN